MPVCCFFYWFPPYLNLYEVAIFSAGMVKSAVNIGNGIDEQQVMPAPCPGFAGEVRQPGTRAHTLLQGTPGL